MVGRVENRGGGGGYDDAFDAGGVSFDGFEDSSGSLDGWVKTVADWVVPVQLVRGCRVDYVVEGGFGFDGLFVAAG